MLSMSGETICPCHSFSFNTIGFPPFFLFFFFKFLLKLLLPAVFIFKFTFGTLDPGTD